MSGIYINCMEMPDSCNLCPFEFSGDCLLSRDVIHTFMAVTRAADCPLIPVPDHGRLIDADAFKKRMMQGAIDAREDALTDEIWLRILDAAKSLCLDIDEQPTIIPADKEEEG